MKRSIAGVGLTLIFVFFLGAILQNVACMDWDEALLEESNPKKPEDPTGTDPENIEYYDCVAEVTNCGKKEKPVSVKVSGPGGGTSEVDPKLETGYKLYVNRPWFIEHVPPLLQGAIFIRTDHDHRHESAGEWLLLDFASLKSTQGLSLPSSNKLIKDLYVAYDWRANPLPQWLTSDYEPVMDKLGPMVLPTSMPNKASGAGTFVDLRVFRLKDTSKFVEQPSGAPIVHSIPGNNAGNPGWNKPKVPEKNVAMYVVIVTREKDPDCQPGDPVHENLKGEGCAITKDDAEKLATDLCNKQRKVADIEAAFLSCQTATCDQKQICPKDTVSYKAPLIQKRYYKISSVIEFDPDTYKSEANIKVQNQNFTSKVKGKLYFEYLLDELDRIKEMRVDGMTLER
jgi:hypothetical protein